MRANRTVRALCMVSLLVGAILGIPAPVDSAQDTKRPDDQTHQRLREANRRVLASLAKDLERPESRPADPRARAEVLGRDPARIIGFVQKLRFEPYPGLQRGPAGVLATGAGNSLDKAFLLRELLRASGFEARMVRGTLPEERARSIVKASLEGLKARPAGRWRGPFGGGEVDPARLEASCREAGVPADDVLRLVRAEEHAERAVWAEVKALASREAGFLEAHRGPGGLTPVPMAGALVESARNHAWVQWKARDQNAWTDSEAVFAGSGPGVPSEGELDPAGAADRFVLTLSLERKVGEKRETVEVLKRDVGAYEVLTEPMRFMIQPTDLALPKPGDPFTPEDFYKQMAGGREFLSVVRVGEQPASLMVFDYAGQVSKPKMAAGKIGGSAGGTVAGVAGLFGEAKKEEKSTLERLWVDLSMSRGGKPLWTQRRTILEEGAREAWCPVLTWDFFLPSGEISADFVRSARVSHRLRNQPAFDAVDEWARSKNGDLATLAKVQVVNFPLGLLAFAVARQAFVEAVGGRQPWLYFESPNVFISGRQARLHVKDREVCLCYGIDLVDNGALVLEAGEDFLLDRAGTTALGAFDTVLEQSRIAEANVPESALGALAFFERARVMGHPMRLMPAGDAAALQAAGVSRADAEWIGKRGQSVLVAAGMDRSHCGGMYAWWEYDPRTGRALGRLAGGRGGCEALLAPRQDLAEYMELISSLNNAICAGKVLGMLLAGKNDAARNEALDCLVDEFKGKMLEMSGLGVIKYVADLLDFKNNLAGK